MRPSVPPAPAVRVDDSGWPIVVVTWPDRALDDGELMVAVEKCASYAHRGRPYAIVQDASRAVPLSAKQRKMAADVGKRDEALSKRWMCGTAVVVSNPVVAAMLTALNWLFPPPYPQKNFSRLDEAREWARSQLARREEDAGGARAR